MTSAISNYLKKRGIKGPWELAHPPNQLQYSFIIVIPAFCELEYLPLTLQKIAEQPPSLLDRTLVVIVVNHSTDVSDGVLTNNAETLTLLENSHFPVEMNWVDAASKGLELPVKFAGVGLARKIGMDLSLPYAQPDSLLCCLDADTIVEPDYQFSIESYFKINNCPAAVVNFVHQKSDNPKVEAAIRLYEKFIKTTAQRIRAAGSPFGYHAIGSTMVCTAGGYCAVGGVPRKKAGEDFYFLQEIAKYRSVGIIDKILVHPSPRLSDRVHLGTGSRLKQALDGLNLLNLFYSDMAFSVLERWLKLAIVSYKTGVETLLESCLDIDSSLPDFLLRENIKTVWGGLQRSSPSKEHFPRQFHRWFDGLKTIRLLKNYSK